MKSRLAPSPTLLLHLAVVLLGAALTMGFTTKVRLSPRPASVAAPDIRMHAMTPVRMAIGPATVLPAGSRWRAAGLLAQGTVYRPLNHVVLLEGQRVDEAWPVVSAGRLQGFFLPAEARFAPVRHAVPLPLAPASPLTPA
jgi:hypothetical protein